MNSAFERYGRVSPHGDSVQVGVIEAIADWCDALHGTVSLQDAFGHLVRGLGAEAGMIVRTHLNEFHPIRVAIYDSQACDGIAALFSSFADGYFGPHLVRPRAATVWLASTHAGEAGSNPAPALAEWQAARRLTEFAVLVLSGGTVTRDHIELHFREPLSADAQASLGVVLPTMARTWATRQVGLITRTVVNSRLSACQDLRGSPKLPLLGTTNPARLSRAEFRVCLLLSRGLSILGVSEELSLSEATVRSHLRSIYAKTETSGLAELVFHLLGSHLTVQEIQARCA